MKIRCNNCYWEGEEEDLKDFVDLESKKEVLYFKGCPNCKTDEYLMDLVEEKKK